MILFIEGTAWLTLLHGRSLFSVAENSASVALDANGVMLGRGGGMGRGGATAPISASLQELQGLDDRRNKYLESLSTKDRAKQSAPVSNTLQELQDRQVSHVQIILTLTALPCPCLLQSAPEALPMYLCHKSSIHYGCLLSKCT